MCNLASIGYQDMIVTGSFFNDINIVDMNPSLDCYFLQQKEEELKNSNKDCKKDTKGSFCSSRKLLSLSLSPQREKMKKKATIVDNDDKIECKDNTKLNDLHVSNYGMIASNDKLRNILTSICVNPNSLHFVCGTLENSIQIISCGSSPLQEKPNYQINDNNESDNNNHNNENINQNRIFNQH